MFFVRPLHSPRRGVFARPLQLAVMRMRELRSGDRDSEGSSLEYGLDYAVKRLRRMAESNAASVSSWDADKCADELRSLTDYLDKLREFYTLLCFQLGYLACVVAWDASDRRPVLCVAHLWPLGCRAGNPRQR